MSQLYMALEDTLDHLLWVGERVLDGEDLPETEKIREQVESVTREDIREVARQIFKTQHANLALIGPVSKKVQDSIRKDFELPGR